MQNTGALAPDAYLRLRAEILHGELRPNERLVESELAQRLQISRTPIREVLQRLSFDGLVVSRRRGWEVREHSLREISEVYEVRAALEGHAARLAATRAEPAALETLRRIHGDGGTDTVHSPREHLVEVNDTFHDAVIAAAGNDHLAEMARRSRQWFFNYRIAKLYTDEEATAALAGHGRLLEALEARDADAADRAAREHVDEALAQILAKTA